MMEAGLLKGLFHPWGWRLPVPGGQEGGEAGEEDWVQSRPSVWAKDIHEGKAFVTEWLLLAGETEARVCS